MITKLTFLSTKLNVLFLCGWYPSKVSPTNGDFIQRHAEAVSLNHNVTVIHIITDKENKERIEFTNETINGIETHIAYIKYTTNPIKKICFYIRTFKTLLQKTGSIDIVHLNQTFPFGVFSLYLKWFKKIPFIISEHYTGYLKNSNSKITFFQKQVSKCIVRKSSFVCPVSNYLYKDLIDLGIKGNYEIVPNIIDTELFIPVKKEDSFLKLIHISSLKDEHKNIKGMLRVAKLLSKRLAPILSKTPITRPPAEAALSAISGSASKLRASSFTCPVPAKPPTIKGSIKAVAAPAVVPPIAATGIATNPAPIEGPREPMASPNISFKSKPPLCKAAPMPSVS